MSNVSTEDKTITDECIYNHDKTVLLFYPKRNNNKVVKIPPQVKEIGRLAFFKSDVEKVVCNDGLVTIGDGAFFSCNRLREIVLPDTIIKIGEGVFHNCRQLIRIKLPNGLTDIKAATFNNCENLTEIYLPKGIKNIDLSAFYGCNSLEEFRFIDE